tara:strand:- start:1394 stop:1618 length:225 start_codon:yes stop_codon:yes gene_type:complete
MKENILFIILMSPLFLSIFNRVNGIEHTNTKPAYIWEDQDRFGTAFKLARSFLGSDGIFTWQGKEYTTLYKEEL